MEELEDREMGDDPSLLRFLVDMRGEDLTSKVLRDDLMTMLIAGHETTAVSVIFSLSQIFPAQLSFVMLLMLQSTSHSIHRQCLHGLCLDLQVMTLA